ncbi:predicted protein [Chaetomium globosum CBS 148.51]|uniref:Uncharacterized protein n=1 Tax=Chaetomium globosum (strain ATCC 6205 / CBS 148.51 / DSM 1962 / NBRC 6347 / NRRL 1970) TaxID=306901 RepID=Q2GWU4_CHAGB|nr:uncharacterized protein CHGG_07560 [Chaetomium globosum CBS 148.51]EAQ86307.1 predicted protein [Chaetomium globosum CBS 148.51]
MVRSVLSLALAALTLFPSPATAQDGVKDGPNVLDECVACPYLYKTFYTCARSVSGPTRTNVGDCVCPPPAGAGSDNGWYPYIEACATCLPREESGDFWTNVATVFWQTTNECRGPRNVTTDADGVLCIGTAKMDACLALRDASEGPSWASYRLFDYEKNNSNKTKVLNLAAFKPNTTSSEAAAASTTAAPGTATGLESASASTTDQAGTATGPASAATTTTDSSLAAARLGQGSPAGFTAPITL